MDPCTDTVFCFDHAPAPAVEGPPPPRTVPGFHSSESTVFYVTADGRVYLLRTPDESACLHQCRTLPATAVHTTSRVEPMLEILARAADDLGRPTTRRMRSIREEVRRDRLVGVATLLQETLVSVGEELERLLLDECPPDPAGLHERLSERLAEIDRQRLALESQGINRRGERENVPPPAPDVPAAAAPFVHRGEYLGWFVGLHAAAAALPTLTDDTAAELRDAHMRGDLWTVARDGLVYVFRCRPATIS